MTFDCPHCAASASGRCLACKLGNPRLRELADRDPAYARLVREGFPESAPKDASRRAAKPRGSLAASIARERREPP